MRKQRAWLAGWAIAFQLFLLFLSVRTFAQDNAARVTGRVRSPEGAGLAQTTLIFQNAVSGAEVTVRTDSEGRYQAEGLLPASYRITVSLAGFVTQVRSEVELAAGQTFEAEFLLEPEGASSASESSSSGPSRTGVIDEFQLTGLPMNGRNVSQLATLEAGVSDSSSGSGRQASGGGSLTMSGGRGEWNGFLMDGTDINDTDNSVPRSAAGGQLGADALAQIRVFSPNYDAQYGRAAGGVISAVTRAGSNDWHVTVFEFFRNSKLDARNFFDIPSKPPFKRNQFGGTVAGPIRKDHTFFMFSSETLLDRLTVTYISFVPDNNVRAGTLSLPGRAPIPVDPRVKRYFPYYLPAGQPLLDSENRPTGVAESRYALPLPTNEYFFVARMDQRLSDRDAWFARYTFDDASNRVGGSSLSVRQNESRQQYVTLVHTHFISPASLNTARLSYTRPTGQSTAHYFVTFPRELFFVPTSLQFGGFIVPGLTNFSEPTDVPSSKVMNSYQFSDDFIQGYGAHTLKFGMVAERFQWNVYNHESMGGRWTFSSLENFIQAGTRGTRLQLGLPDSIPDRAFRQSLFAFYGQDDFKVRSNLTLNLGLRYEFTTRIRDVRERTTFLLDELHDPEPRRGPMMSKNPSLLNLSPRFGLRWAPGSNSNTVVSAGFGIYYDPIIEYSIDSKRSSIPFFNLAVRHNFDASSTFPDAVASAGVADQIRIMEYNDPRQPTVYRYNLTLQQELLTGLSLQAGYVGARGNHLLRTFEANQMPFPIRQPDGSLFFPADCNATDLDPKYRSPAFCRPGAGSMNPAFGSMQKTNTDGQSFYNSFFVSLRRSLRNGLSFNANYTYGKSVDDASSAGMATTHYGLDRKLNRGLSSFDIRHRLSLNYFYDLPVGSGKRWLPSGWLAQIAGGWRVSGILSVRSGRPFDPDYGIPTPGFLFTSQRPNMAPGFSKIPTSGTTAGCEGVRAGQEVGGANLYFDPCAFSVPQPGTLGSVGRTIITGPRTVNMDFSLQKNFALDSKRNLQFRTEFFNLANHPNFQQPSLQGSNIFRSAEGRVSPSAGKLTDTATTPRQIQFALRLSF